MIKPFDNLEEEIEHAKDMWVKCLETKAAFGSFTYGWMCYIYNSEYFDLVENNWGSLELLFSEIYKERDDTIGLLLVIEKIKEIGEK